MNHRAHDYRHLVERWRGVARRSGVPLRQLVTTDGYPHFFLRTPALAETDGIYISAGIHGDEAGATEGLIAWAEKHARRLARLPLLILPCLNPSGLVANRRTNVDGVDLNRSFQHEELPLIRAIRKLIGTRQFAAALTMHEDFDGQGVYLYEIHRTQPSWGEALLAAARSHVPIDPRLRIDGRKVARGIYRRRVDRRHFAEIGYPEAIWLHLEHSARTFTVETPSEFALEQRVAAHVAMLEETIRRVSPGSIKRSD